MWVLPKEESREHICDLLKFTVAVSRFTAHFEFATLANSRPGLKISNIRLRNKKGYCGAHPGPCVALVERKHKVTRFLEGLDWVGFNHMLNDVLDEISANCIVFSFNRESTCGKYYIRRGRLRRVHYPYEYVGNFAGWSQGEDNDFQDFCGRLSPGMDQWIVNSGTPGYPCYILEEEAKYRAEEQEYEEEIKEHDRRTRNSRDRTTAPVLV